MGTRYRVTVERIDDVEDTQYETRETVLFETTSPSLLSLLRYAPTEVDAALRDAAGLETVTEWERAPVPAEAWAAATNNPDPNALRVTVFDANGTVIGAAAGSEPATDEVVVAPPKQRKPRRSAAQKAADEEAARLAGERMQAAVNGAQQAQEQVTEAQALPVAVPTVEDVTSIANSNVVAETVPQPAPVPAAPPTEPAPLSPAAEALAPSVPAADGEVWNPFKR